MAKISKASAKALRDAQDMVFAFRKIGKVGGHTTTDLIHAAKKTLTDVGDIDGADCMSAELERRAADRARIMPALLAAMGR